MKFHHILTKNIENKYALFHLLIYLPNLCRDWECACFNGPEAIKWIFYAIIMYNVNVICFCHNFFYYSLFWCTCCVYQMIFKLFLRGWGIQFFLSVNKIVAVDHSNEFRSCQWLKRYLNTANLHHWSGNRRHEKYFSLLFSWFKRKI